MHHDHVHGMALAGISAGVASGAAWLASHIQTVDWFLYCGVLFISLITGIIGLRKVLKTK